MNLRPVLGLAIVGAVVAMSQPKILSAQSDVRGDQPQVRIKLLESGEMEVTGDFILEGAPVMEKELWLSGTTVFEDRNRDPAAVGSFLLMIETPTLEGVSDTVTRAQDARVIRVR